MKKSLPVFLLIDLILGVVFFIAADNLIIGLGILIIGVVLSIFIFSPTLENYKRQCTRYHENFHFINNYIIALSVKKSLAGALESTIASMSAEFGDMMQSVEKLSDFEKLQYLISYFKTQSYQLFFELVDLWQEEGGDILQMSKYLLSQTRFEEEYITKTSACSIKSYFEIGTLWLISLAILVLLRFSLKDFYNRINTLPIFLGSLIVLGIFIYFSIFLLLNKGTKIDLKGVINNEKNI